MIENNYKQKIIESIESNIKVLKNGIKDLEKDAKSGKKLDLNFKEQLLDAVELLEIAIYRTALYRVCVSKNELCSKVERLNMDLNTIVAEYDVEEFTHILNYKIISLLTFIIDHITC